MKLVVQAFLTLDGVMEGPGDAKDSRGANHGGWLSRYSDPAIRETLELHIRSLDALLLGRRTYEAFAAHWPHAGVDDAIGCRLNTVPKYVATRSSCDLPWDNSHALGTDIVREVVSLKREPFDELQVHGSGDLVHSLLRLGLVDELRLWWVPFVNGQGKPLFGGTVPLHLELTELRAFPRGVVLHQYRVTERGAGSELPDLPKGLSQARPRVAEERT